MNLPWPIIAGWLLANLIPYLSALVTKAPSWGTGAITLGLSALDGILSEAAAGRFDPRTAVLVALAAWGVAALQHSKVLRGTKIEAALHSALRGSATPHPRPRPPAAVVT